MKPESYLYIPRTIILRRYDDIEISNIETDEDYTIDEEAYELLKKIDGKSSVSHIISDYPESKREEIEEVLEFFLEEEIIKLNNSNDIPKDIVSLSHLELPKKNPFNPPYLKFLMINITEKCNLTCKHCYITNKHQIDMPFDKLKGLIKDFYNLQGLKLILTGGEPFLYKDLEELLYFLKEFPLKKVILTNGILIKKNKHLLNLIKNNNFEVFVSIDGLEETHNDFRNANCFKDSIQGIKLLLENGITVSINTMVHKKNLKEFDELSKYLRSLGNIKTWTVEVPTFDEIISEEIIKEYDITPEEGGIIMRDYWWGVSYDSSGVVFDSDNLEALEEEPELDSPECEENPKEYACGPFLMAIDVTGGVSKCGFFTEKSPGNVFELGFKESWKGIQDSCVWDIKDLKCKELECEYLDECRGGCRYRAQKHTDNLYSIDPYKCVAYGKFNEELKKFIK